MPNQWPFRIRVLDALATCLSAISPDSDTKYVNDLSDGKVWVGRLIFGANDPLPALSILEAVAQDDPLTGAPIDAFASEGWWVLYVQGFVQYDSAHPTRPAHVLMADVAMALSTERKRQAANKRDPDMLGMGGKVVDIKIGFGVARPPDEVSGTAYFWLPVALQLVENRTDPYA